MQQFKGISITIATRGPFGPYRRVEHCNDLLPLPLLQLGLRQRVQALRGIPAPSGALFMSHSLFRGIPAAARTYPQPQRLRGVPSPAWTYAWATSPSEVELLQHRHNHGHRRFEIYLLWCGLIHSHSRFGVSCSRADSSTGHSPVDSGSPWSSSLSITAAQKQQRWPGHLPAQARGPCCYEDVPRTQQSKRISSTAVQQAAKAKSSH